MTRPSTTFPFTKQDVDARHKAGHDEKENTKAGSDPGLFFFRHSEATRSVERGIWRLLREIPGSR
jgi:hypothetical protein